MFIINSTIIPTNNFSAVLNFFHNCVHSQFQNWTYSKMQQQCRCNFFVAAQVFLDYSALARNDAPCTWVEYSGRVWSSYIGLCQSILEKVQQLLKLNYCSFGESYHSLIVVGGKGRSNTKVNKTRIWWEAMIRSLVRRFCQKQLSLKTCANYSFLKKDDTTTIIRDRSRLFSSDKRRWSFSLSERIVSISPLVLVILQKLAWKNM